jgi:hypothetical protein
MSGRDSIGEQVSRELIASSACRGDGRFMPFMMLEALTD